MKTPKGTPPASQTKGWKLVWNDEFDGAVIDRDKWDFDIGNGFFDYKSHTWVPGWGNEELQYYTDSPENAFVKDGALHIRAERVNDFATPCFINLLCRVVLFQSVSFPLAVG